MNLLGRQKWFQKVDEYVVKPSTSHPAYSIR